MAARRESVSDQHECGAVGPFVISLRWMGADAHAAPGVGYRTSCDVADLRRLL